MECSCNSSLFCSASGTAPTLVPPVLRGLTELFLVVENLAQVSIFTSLVTAILHLTPGPGFILSRPAFQKVSTGGSGLDRLWYVGCSDIPPRKNLSVYFLIYIFFLCSLCLTMFWVPVGRVKIYIGYYTESCVIRLGIFRSQFCLFVCLFVCLFLFVRSFVCLSRKVYFRLTPESVHTSKIFLDISALVLRKNSC